MTAAGSARIAGIVLAAGGATRYGAPKQLAPFRGKPLLEHALAAIKRAGLDPVVVVLGAEAERVRAGVSFHGAEPVICENWDGGLAESLRTGIEAVGGADAAVITLGDQPLVSPEAIARVVAARDGRAAAVRATYDGEPGHPVLLEREALWRAHSLSGDEGGRQLFRNLPVCTVACDGFGSAADVDVPADLYQLEAAAVAAAHELGGRE